MTKDLFRKIATFCIKENRYFQYKDKYYLQIQGLPMGSPISPIVADIVMEELIDQCINITNNKPKILTKYVDDIFAIVNKTSKSDFLNLLNKFHKNIKFTIEEEKNNKLAYLDTLVIRDNNNIRFDWYKKPTSSGRLMNFYSKHPKNIIMNTAKNFTRRVLNISDRIYWKKNIANIKQTLHNNNFPKYLIQQIIDKHVTNNKIERQTSEDIKIYKSLTYIPTLTDRLKHANIYNKNTHKIAPKTFNTLRQLHSNPKSKIEKWQKSNVIYSIKCNGDKQDQCNKVYIGTTGNTLKTRITGHKSDFRCRNNNNINKTALITHCKENNHEPDFDNTKIVAQENKYTQRLTLEMLHILNTPADNRINYKSDTDNCAQAYRKIITNINKQKHHHVQ